MPFLLVSSKCKISRLCGSHPSEPQVYHRSYPPESIAGSLDQDEGRDCRLAGKFSCTHHTKGLHQERRLTLVSILIEAPKCEDLIIAAISDRCIDQTCRALARCPRYFGSVDTTGSIGSPSVNRTPNHEIWIRCSIVQRGRGIGA